MGRDCVRWQVWGKECWFDGDGLRIMVRTLEVVSSRLSAKAWAFLEVGWDYSGKRRLFGGETRIVKACTLYSVIKDRLQTPQAILRISSNSFDNL